MADVRQRADLFDKDRDVLTDLGNAPTLSYGQYVQAKSICDKYVAHELMLNPGRIIKTHNNPEEAFIC